MKKSKILAVALSALTFSTAAAVTGTVAWYFAQRTVSVSMSNITSFNPESGLKVTLANGIGTAVGTASSTSASAPATVSHGLIRDGSVDLESGKAYRTVLNSKGDAVVGYKALDLTNATEMSGKVTTPGADPEHPLEDKDFYYATSYKATFELARKEKGKTFAVYYDNSQLVVGGHSMVQESLRIGFVYDAGTPNDDSDDAFFVVSPFRNAGGKTFIQSESISAAQGDYTGIASLTPANRLMYGYETEYKKNGTNGVITGDDNVDVNIPDFDYDHYELNDRFVEVQRTNPDGPTPEFVTKLEEAYTPTTKGTPTTDNLASLGVVESGHEADTLGYLGNLAADAQAGDDYLKVNVTVYTWFEGTDASSISDWVDDEDLSVDLKFNMAEVIA